MQVTVKVDEIIELVKSYIIEKLNLPDNVELEYTSKTTFLTFRIIEPGDR